MPRLRPSSEPFPLPSAPQLMTLREIIFDAALATPGVGKLTEALRWQQLSYLTMETGSGSTIRLDAVKTGPRRIALYFHCQSGLFELFEELYGSQLTFGGQRCMVFDNTGKLPKEMIAHCVSLALTHHLRKRKRHDGGTSHHHRHRPRAG
jgi:hypothetical protein